MAFTLAQYTTVLSSAVSCSVACYSDAPTALCDSVSGEEHLIARY